MIVPRFKTLRAAVEAPLLMIFIGFAFATLFNMAGRPPLSMVFAAELARLGLAALVFAAGTQFRLSRLTRTCPVSFRLCFAGAPLFMMVCGLSAFILIPQLTLPAAFLLGGVLMLNGAAFDRRALKHTPAPPMVKAGVRLEGAVILALSLPIVMLLQGNASANGSDGGFLYPLMLASFSVSGGFALGGIVGLGLAIFDKGISRLPRTVSASVCAFIVYIIAGHIGADPIVAAGAVGLIWGEQARVSLVQRLRLRLRVESIVLPLTYLAFGFFLVPSLWGGDLLMATFALAAVTVMRAGPRLVALQQTALQKEAQIFLAWFGGTPGAASALYLLTLSHRANLVDQELLLTLGTMCTLMGVVVARMTSQPLSTGYRRGLAAAHRRKLFG